MGKAKKSTIIIIVISLLAIAGIGGFIWTYTQMAYYRDNAEVIANEAAEIARNEQYKIDEEAFNEKLKEPYKEFVGPTDMGSIKFSYPLTWSAYNTENSTENYGIIFYPGVIPPIDEDTPVALRVEVINNNYEDELSSYEYAVEQGDLSASPITVSGDQTGVLFNGQLNENFTSSFVLLKLRDKTILIQTDTDRYLGDFDNIVLASFEFVP